MARLVLYTRLVSVIQSEPQIQICSHAAQRQGTPVNASKEIRARQVLCGRDGLGRVVLASSYADGRARAKAATGTVGRRVGVERHRVVTFITTLRARLAVQRAGAQLHFHVQVGGVALAGAFQVVKADRCAVACRSVASCHVVGPFRSMGIRQEAMAWSWDPDHSLRRGCRENDFHVCS